MSAASDQERAAGRFPLLEWLPDETLFSLCSRQHLLMGNLDAGTTSIDVLGLNRRFIKHDIPCGISTLERTGFQYLGSAEQILLNHTIFSLFIPFQNKIKIEDAINTVKSDRLDSLKYRLGLISSGFGAEHPLKACPHCMRGDVRAYGIAYWHLTHQYPGVLICPRHQAWLLVSTKSRRWSGRFEWSLPAPEFLIEQASDQKHWNPCAFLALAENVIELASIGRSTTFDAHAVAATYRTAVLQGGRSAALIECTEPLRRFYLFESLPADKKSSESFVNQLLGSHRRSIHPLKHLVLIDWLFDDLCSFTDSYRGELARSFQQFACTTSLAPEDRFSLSSTVTLAKSAPRPKRLKGQLKKDLLAKLSEGDSKQELCEEFQITVSTINKLLRAHPVISSLALKARQLRETEKHRTQWLQLHRLSPELGVQALRNTAPALYAWLYRNDKAWLMTDEQTFPKPARAGKSIIDWEARDSRLLSKLRRESESIAVHQRRPIKMAELYALVPMLSSCLENRERYPRSRAFLTSVLARTNRQIC